MAEAYLQHRLGESRAAVIENFKLVEMLLWRDGDGLSAGARVPAQLTTKLGSRGIARAGAEELMVEPWPAGVSEGATLCVEVTRAAWREQGRDRLAKARPTGLDPWPSPSLESKLHARGLVVKPGWPADVAEQWDERFEQARLGRLPFESGTLVLAPTPAFLAVDVDGHGLSLAVPALKALARAIRLWGLGGSLVVDLPAADKAQRTLAAESFDAAMGRLPFERTAINGFGLLQVMRPRPGPSILERAQLERAATEAIALMAAILADPGTGPVQLSVPAGVRRWLQTRPHLLDELGARSRRTIGFAPDLTGEASSVFAAQAPA